MQARRDGVWAVGGGREAREDEGEGEGEGVGVGGRGRRREQRCSAQRESASAAAAERLIVWFGMREVAVPCGIVGFGVSMVVARRMRRLLARVRLGGRYRPQSKYRYQVGRQVF